MNKRRADIELARRGLAASRSQAESYIKLGKVRLNDKILNPTTSLGAGKSGYLVSEGDKLEIIQNIQYASRAGLKLAGAAEKLGLDFKSKTVLDVGSSTGGFTDYALKHGAAKVIAVDVGTNQLHPTLRGDHRVELHEKTDIRSLRLQNEERRMWNEVQQSHSSFVILHSVPDIVLADVSFISLRLVLPAIAKLSGKNTQIVAMLKPQFEAGNRDVNPSAGSTSSRQASSGFRAKALNKGVIKNDSIRRRIFKDFELWAKQYFAISGKADSEIPGAKGNRERFYLLRIVSGR